MGNPFAADGIWLKTVLHTHSTESDGELAPEHLVGAYEAAGYDVMALTDHWKVTTVPSRKDLLVIPGAELAVDPPAPGRYAEILAVGIDDIPEDPGGDRRYWEPIDNYLFKTFPDYPSAAAEIARQGGVSYVCHPYWSGLAPEWVLGAEGATGIEVWNWTAERDTGRGDSSYVWDLALEAGRPFSGIAGEDVHYPATDIGGAWNMVRAVDRTREAVIEALRNGNSYFSTGPTIRDLRQDGDTLEIATSPALSIVLRSSLERGWGVRADHFGRQDESARILERADDGSVVRASFRPDGDVPYTRFQVVNAQGRSAWTNPV